MVSVEFLITSLIVILVPGTGVVFTVSTGLVQGRAATVYAAAGCALGVLPHLAATVFGLAAVMHVSAVAFDTLKMAGVTYLFWLAYSTWRNPTAFSTDARLAMAGDTSIVVKALLLNILNPKLTIFFLAFLPQFADLSSSAPVLQLLILSAIFMALTFAVFAVYGLIAHAFRRIVIESPRVQTWLRRGFATTFAALGTQLASAER